MFCKPLLMASLGLLLLHTTLTQAAGLTYQYDAFGRLRQVIYSDGGHLTYNHDGADNRISFSLAQSDRDGDGLPDHWEQAHGLNPNHAGDATSDRDGDGLTALAEYLADTDPNAAAEDGDGDGLPDVWEVRYALDYHDGDDAYRDPDSDGLDSRAEYLAGRHPRVNESALVSTLNILLEGE